MMRWRVPALLALALATIAATPPVAPVKVYSDGLQPGWDDWSWATRAPATFPGDPGMKPLKIDAGPWAAVAFHAAKPFDLTGRRGIVLFVNGGDKGGQTIGIIPVVEGKGLVEKSFDVTLPAGGQWQKVEVPFVHWALPGHVIDAIWIQNRTASPAPTFWIEDVIIG